MGDYFRPRRRKIGVWALLIAVLLTAGWVKSSVSNEKFCIHTSEPSHLHLHVVGGHVWLTRLMEQEASLKCRWHSSSNSTNVIICSPEQTIWHKKLGQFEIGEFHEINIGKHSYLIFPLWLIAVPMALVSVGLLLTRSREPTPTTNGPVRDQAPSGHGKIISPEIAEPI